MPAGPLRRAVFLDRDGVINRAIIRAGRPHPPAVPAEVEILPGVPAALSRLKAAGYWLVVVTNQPDVARGMQTRAGVEALHIVLQAQLPLDDIQVCYHDERDGCECRKPAPGLLVAAAQSAGIDLRASFMVGDRWRDVAAGQQAGCQSIFIDCGYAEPQPHTPYLRVHSLREATDLILTEQHVLAG